ncbi:ABC transporter permease [bacterium]|nr:ABC transporter permease [bacterium]
MNFFSALRIGFQSIMHQKFRSFLTMLGIIFGVGAVISMLSIGRGAEEEIIKQIREYGARNIIIKSSVLGKEKLQLAKRNYSVGLSMDDVAYLDETCDFIVHIAPQAVIETGLRYNGKNPKCSIVGINESFAKVFEIKTNRGRFIRKHDVDEYRLVCVLGYEIKKELFVNRNPVGKKIMIGGKHFTVIGFLPDKSSKNGTTSNAKALKSRDVNRDVYIPISTALKKFSLKTNSKGYKNSSEDPTYHRLTEVILSIENENQLRDAGKIISKILKRRHKEIDDVELVIPLEILEQSQKTQEIFGIVLSLIASLSLLVGGIGIMNIMLATVNERTKEIGIRRSIGASKNDIRLQFLIEGVLISIAGGIIGIGLGFVLSHSVSHFLEWSTMITSFSVILSFAVSFTVGIVFSYFPASKAANLDPIEALRHE